MSNNSVMYLQLLLCTLCATLFSPVWSKPTNQLLGSSFGVPGLNASFDYVIVGGGTAGLVMAARLAEDPLNSVAVVEAGGFYEVDNGNISVIPGYATMFAGTDPAVVQPLVDWGFVTEPQEGANNRRLHYTRGKTLGGSSARNYMVYHRPTIGSLDEWAATVGDSSYTFENFLPYYKTGIDYTPPKTLGNRSIQLDPAAFSANGGPLHVSYGNYIDAFATWVQLALQAVGMSAINGFNSGRLIGSAFSTSTIDPSNAHRSSSESSFLQSAIKDTTLQVYKQTLAQKILFGGNSTAIGVAVRTRGNYGKVPLDYTLSARKEVIVSAGAFQSPQMLMVSGIGPKELLESHGIPVVKDLPGVGQNMWDHALFPSSFRVNILTTSALQNDPAALAEAVDTYLHNASGLLSVFSSGIYGWEKLPDPQRSNLSASTQKALAIFPADWPEIEWLTTNTYSGIGASPRDGYNYAGLRTALITPLSRGNVSINSSSMDDAPLINPNWITHPADIELAIAAFKRQRQVWGVLSSYNLTIGEEQSPGLGVQSDAEILNYIRESLAPVWHASSTCKMGKRNDTMAVIDHSAHVYGTQGLRVVDASSFPFLPPGHPQSTVYALAEKIASEILAGH